MSGMRLLVVQELCAWYGPAQVLHGLNFEVLEGEVVALVGPNGAGKSSTLKALMGLMPRRSGHLWFMGETLDQARPHAVAQRGIGYVPEDRRVFGDLTVLENVLVQTDWSLTNARAKRTEAMEMLEVVGLADRAGKPGAALSGGGIRRRRR